jgi:hypothetical protein
LFRNDYLRDVADLKLFIPVSDPSLITVADSVSGANLTPGSRRGKNPDPGSGIWDEHREFSTSFLG